MLSNLTVQNFKILRQAVTVEPRLITVFVGANGTGKSSLMQALLFLKQSVRHEKPNFQEGPYVTFDSWRDVVYRGSKDDLTIEMTVTDPSMEVLPGIFPAGVCTFIYKLTFSYDSNLGSAVLKNHNLRLLLPEDAGEWGFYTPARPGIWNVEPQSIKRESGQVGARFYGSYSIGGPFQFRLDGWDPLLQKRLTELRFGISNFLTDCKYVGLQRIPKKDTYEILGGGPVADLLNEDDLAIALAEEKTLDEVNEWLQRITGRTLRAEYRRQAPNEISFDVYANGHRMCPLSGEGSGTKQLVWQLTQIAAAPESSLICVEEPEIHLHPLGQATLVDGLVMVARQTHRQLLFATHSEHFVVALLNNVAEKKLKPEDLAIYYFSFKDEARKENVTLARIDVDEEGRTAGGLPGFLEADLQQLERHLGSPTHSA